MLASSTSARTPMIRRPLGLMPATLIRGSVHRMCRFSASCPGNKRCATVLLTTTTNSEAHEQGGSEHRPLRKRLIDCQIALGENVGIVHVSQDTTDPAALRADARDFNQRIRPHYVPV